METYKIKEQVGDTTSKLDNMTIEFKTLNT